MLLFFFYFIFPVINMEQYIKNQIHSNRDVFAV